MGEATCVAFIVLLIPMLFLVKWLLGGGDHQ